MRSDSTVGDGALTSGGVRSLLELVCVNFGIAFTLPPCRPALATVGPGFERRL
jgi:hypothetical protein